MSRRAGGPATGYLSPSGQLWQVPTYPRPHVVLADTEILIDGQRHPIAPGQEARDAATAPLVDLALRLRGEAGAIHADVTTPGSDTRWQVIVTGTGEVFDATPTGSGPGRGGRRPGRRALAVAAALTAVLALGTAVIVVTTLSTAPTPTATGPSTPPSGTPVPYPQLPPPGYAATADWSAVISAQVAPIITSTGQVVTVSPDSAAQRTVDVRDPRTGVPVWSAVLPPGAATATTGLRLSVIDGQESVVATTTDKLVWWPVTGDHTPRTVPLPPNSTVSYAGSTVLLTWPGQRAGLITDGALTEVAVPAGAVAVGASGSTVVATNSVGQLWRLTAATAEFPPDPIATAAPVPGATVLESVAGYAAPIPATDSPEAEVLVLTWFTPDPATRVVSLLDAATGEPIGDPTTVARSEVGTGGWRAAGRNTLGAVGQVLIDVTATTVHTLPDRWRTTAITDTQVYGHADGTALVAAPDGTTAPTGSGSIPLGTAAGLMVVTAAVGPITTVYGLPPSPTDPGPTPSVRVPAPPAPRPTGPVPAPAPAPGTDTTPPPPTTAGTP